MNNKFRVEDSSKFIADLKKITYEQYIFFYKYWVEGMFNDKYKNYIFYGNIKDDCFKIVFLKYGNNCFNKIIEGTLYNDSMLHVDIKNNFRFQACYILLYITIFINGIMLLCESDILTAFLLVTWILIFILLKKIDSYMNIKIYDDEAESFVISEFEMYKEENYMLWLPLAVTEWKIGRLGDKVKGNALHAVKIELSEISEIWEPKYVENEKMNLLNTVIL